MDDMVIFARMLDLLKWLLPHCEKYPRAHRFGLTERLQGAAFDVLEQLYAANATTGETRLNALRTADGRLNSLRMYLRLAHDLGWMTGGQYRHVSAMVAEIGRLLGGWIKQTRKV